MAIFVGIIGLIIGSFLNVLIYRLNDPKAPKWWHGRSLCPNCKHQISWFDNIPLLSFLILRGQCRYCHKKISWQYPTVELVTSLFFMMTPPAGGVIWLLGCAFIVIFFSDLIYGFIPDEMIIIGVIASIAFTLEGKQSFFVVGIFTAFPFLILAIFKKMGFGDVKLAFLMGLLLGWPKIAVALWSGFILGGFVAVVLLVLRKTKLSATIPLGPFLVIGTLFVALWTDQVILWLKF